ncbi:MAG: response regulator [Lachnospiraceae bacterium]|nr:response regulator [Lachnospiraceae bacterium]
MEGRGNGTMEYLKLYIIDDEPIILEGLVRTYAWEDWGFTVAGASVDPQRALLEVEEKKPDIVITDVRMKGMSGLELICRLKEKNDDLLYVVISAYRDFSYAQKACELGAFTYLLKPLDDDKFRTAMAAAGDICRQQKRVREILKRYADNGDGRAQEVWSEEAYLQNIRRNAREYIGEAVRFIQENLSEETLNIKQVAEEVHLNAMYFGRIFKQCMDMSFKQYLLEERMKKAKMLLSRSNASISQISEQVGMPNASYFTQQFKKQAGCLPTEYKKQAGCLPTEYKKQAGCLPTEYKKQAGCLPAEYRETGEG